MPFFLPPHSLDPRRFLTSSLLLLHHCSLSCRLFRSLLSFSVQPRGPDLRRYLPSSLLLRHLSPGCGFLPRFPTLLFRSP